MWGNSLGVEMQLANSICERVTEAQRAHRASRALRLRQVEREIARLQAELDATERRDKLVLHRPAASGCN